MSVGFSLLAEWKHRFSAPEDALRAVETWIQQRCAEVVPSTRLGFVDTYPTLFCDFHPAAEELELSLVAMSHLRASANTSTVGPGYHIYLCTMLHSWAQDFGATWLPEDREEGEYLDEAEFFFTGDESRVFHHMTSWLRALAASFFDATIEEGSREIALCMPMDWRFECDALAITPLGPRDRQWMEATARDGANGRDFFAWWKPGLSAEYFLGRALAQMWTYVRWRPPLSDAERELLDYVDGSLRSAHALAPGLPYPWAEWAEILDFLGNDPDMAAWARLQATGPPAIGYRRRHVLTMLPGGWWIRLPGSFGRFIPDEDNYLCAVDEIGEVWFTPYRYEGNDRAAHFESIKAEIVASAPEFLREEDGFIAGATIQEKVDEAGDPYFLLSSSAACVGDRAVCTIIFLQPKHRQTALEIWRSLQPPPPDP